MSLLLPARLLATLFLSAVALGVWPGTATADERAAWAALRDGGSVAVIRHARAPGFGDPPGFRRGACETQRNLNEAGRRQARALGERFRAENVVIATVRTSRWCRTEETAREAFPQVERLSEPALDSLVESRSDEVRQTARVRELVTEWAGRTGVLVLVTHQVNATALTGLSPAEGSVIVLRPSATGGAARVVGTITP